MRALSALFIRSIREDVRARLPPIFRAVLVLLVLLIMWANERSFGYRAAPGREFFLMVMMLNMGFIGLLALGSFASAIAEEKEDGTMTLLRMTNLGAISILLGKGASRLVAALLLLAVQIPFTMLAITLGGITRDQILFAYAVLGATTVFICAVGLAASVFCRSAARAGSLTAVILGVIFMLMPMLAITTTLRRMGPAAMTANDAWEQVCIWAVQANPMYALVMLLENPGTVMFVKQQLWIMLGGAVVFFTLAWAIFGRFCAGAEDAAGSPRKRGNGGAKPRRFAVPRAWTRAIAWKDLFFLVGGKAGLLLRLALAALVFAGVYSFTRWLYEPWWMRSRSAAQFDQWLWTQVGEMTMVFGCLCGGLELLLAAGRMFGGEYRRQTLSSLVALPMSVWRIIGQKLLGGAPCMLPWLLLIGTGFAVHPDALLSDVFEGIGRMRYDEWAATYYITMQSLLLLTLVVWFSLWLRRGALPAAIVVSAVVNVCVGIVADTPRMHETPLLFLGGLLTSIVLAVMVFRVRVRIEHAAAEDS